MNDAPYDVPSTIFYFYASSQLLLLLIFFFGYLNNFFLGWD